MGLQLPNKVPERRVKAKLREDRQPALQANETWAMDLVRLGEPMSEYRAVMICFIVETSRAR
jgi:putative transposase